ncbi:MAG: sigma-54-dependent Fis family transcriptional regulator [Deltaproteobacteria bacterium]|nr:MAG: sigma-54-dependent Fis family transcriptional regulator [Deltaproteobacteria bacterium]
MSEHEPQRAPLLLVEDDHAFRTLYRGLLEDAGYAVEEADDRPSAERRLAEGTYPVILLDLMLPPEGTVEAGLALLRRLTTTHPETKVIVASGAGDRHFMVEAVRLGAYDFLTKPVDPDVLLIVAQRALERWRLERQVESLQRSLAQEHAEATLVGDSPSFREALRFAERLAGTDLPVLITGENGTGKELLARAMHAQSRRAGRPFLAINCGALSESLLESTLFGHVKGAFTGAHTSRKGLFVEADGGTLFLDEVGDMPPALQVKLLRVLETGEILPVGRDRPLQVDVRILSATNRDLEALQREGAFREDLYWRIRGAEVRLPPLRERPEDLPLLARHFLNRAATLAPGARPKVLSPAAEAALFTHAWPGNLRELRFEMQRATVLAGERREVLPEDFAFTQARAEAETKPAAAPGAVSLAQKIEALERREIEAALAAHEGNRTRAAEALGLSRQGLLKKMSRYGLA